MDSKVDPDQRDGDITGPARAALEASATGPLAQRVSELETLLAVERAEGARRLREMDALMRQTRSALHDLQGDFRRTGFERDQLREQVAASETEVERLREQLRRQRAESERAVTERDGSTAELVASAIARAQSSEAELARAQKKLAALEEDVRSASDAGASERIAALERDLARRDAEITRATERIASLAAAAATARTEAVERVVVSADAATNDDPEATAGSAPSLGSSTYIPVDAEIVRSSRLPLDDESGTYVSVAPDEKVDRTETDSHGAGLESTPARPAPAPTKPTKHIVVSQVRSPPKRPPAARPTFDGLTIEREVERDAGGVLFDARDRATDRAVSVRVLPRGTVRPSSSGVSKLLAVRHHNVVSVLRCDLGPDGPYVVRERPTGERVDAWGRRVGAVTERIALAVALQVARGMREGAAHELFHGDLSPTSLWTDAAGVVRVNGLGLREVLPHRDLRSELPYIAPERRRGDAPDARSDMYSLAACVRFLLGGPAAVEDEGRLAAMRPAPSFATLALVRTLGATSRDDRPETWDEVVSAIDSTLRECAEPPPMADESLLGTLAYRPRALVAVLAVIVTAVALWVHLMPGTETTLRERFNEAVVRAEALEARGNVEGARRIYADFVEGTGDADIELDAARRLDALRD